jgi:ribose transport system substrate-binding protein
MKKLVALLIAAAMVLSLSITAFAAGGNRIVVLVPNADHGWTGSVMTYAEEHAAEITDEGTYEVNVITSTDASNQIQQVEDLIENETADYVVILPQDNTLEVTMRKLADSGIPYVMFDRIIDSASEAAVASVKGDNYGIGAVTAERFIEDGMQPGDGIVIMPGDNSSVPTMRNDGFYSVLAENGWTDEQLADIYSTDYTGWSRSTSKELFVNYLDTHTVDEIAANKFFFTHDDEIAMGILEALKSSEIDQEKKDAFLNAGIYLATSSGLNELYSVLKGIHQKDYSEEVAQLADFFSVTYDPAMIKTAIDDMVAYIGGEDVPQDHVIEVSLVDATNVNDFQGFGDAVAVE